ncbi:unnamed protein product [Schistocephalus solidus]|uniref:Uncharacterized protein n=1 Tax=Schistocephalus solidus TaxID=70667 RepID=A0A183TDJ6_SCHSO|nr:unnamed protein product [Schistocephalus solidus]
MVYDDYDLWEDRTKVNLEAIDEGARSAAISGRLDKEFEARSLENFIDGISLPELKCQFLCDLSGSIKVALDSARCEEAIHTACLLVQASFLAAFGCRQAPAALQGTSVDVFAMGQWQSRDIGSQMAQWQWVPLQPTLPMRSQPQPTSPWRSSPQAPQRRNWRQQRGRKTRSPSSPGVHVITSDRAIKHQQNAFCAIQDQNRPSTAEFTVHFSRLKLGDRPMEDNRREEHQGDAVRFVDHEGFERMVKIHPEIGEESTVPLPYHLQNSRGPFLLRDFIDFAKDSDNFSEEGAM